MGITLTDDEVLTAIQHHGGDPTMFQLRYEPEGAHPGDKVFRRVYPVADDRYVTVSFQFGQPSADEYENWRPVWLGVDGPYTREELEAGA